jgi:hypothetical protein
MLQMKLQILFSMFYMLFCENKRKYLVPLQYNIVHGKLRQVFRRVDGSYIS